MKKIMYLHGFASSGASGTVELLRREFWEKADASHRAAVVAPDIPLDPLVALPMLKAFAARERPGFARICVNPSFFLSKKYDILFVGRHKWMNRRKDGETEFHVTKETIEHFREMEAHQFDGIADEDRALCHGLFGDEDDTILASETRPLFERHYPGMSSSFPGGHRLNAHVVVHTLLPYIRGLNLF